ncbi:MAG: hypothetical protein ACTHNQ_09905 [Microbacterium sp.]|uniref:hypothetical protein n=1 Tax=Microbacterium sp. TaxID=51671 RepID=UPI003F818917
MRKKILTAVCATALAAGAVLAVPTAASASGYGKDINDGCGASYGQLVSTARAIGHIEGSVSGAKNFVESGLAAAHGCG